MTTIAQEKKRKGWATGYRAELLKNRNELIRKLDAQIVHLMEHPKGNPAFITFLVGKSSYKLTNKLDRIGEFLGKVKTSPGFTGSFKSHADEANKEWKRAGCRGAAATSFVDAVKELDSTEKDIESDLRNAVWRLDQYRAQELKAQRDARDAVENQEKAKREVQALTLRKQAAMLASSQARSENAEFEAHIQSRLT